MELKIKNPLDYQAALYIRLSREDENEGPSESVQNQQRMLEEFSRQQRLSVYGVYIDDGWSGTSFERPDFLRMLADIEAGRVNMVITKDLSRLGRDYILTGHYIERYFPEHRVRYLSLLDGIDTGADTAANDITPFRALLNDLYAKDISRKISSVKHDKQRRGLFIGGRAVYGYQLHPTEKNRLFVDEKAAATVRWVFGRALEGMSCRQIAMQLNERGIPSPAAYAGRTAAKPGPYAGLWSSEAVSAMLRNETYVGNMVQGRRRKASYKSKKCIRQQRENWVVVENTHAPIVSREVFERVQLLLSSRRHTRSRTYDFLLKGLIFCHECGYPLAVINRKNARGEDCLYFVCRTYQRFTKAGVCSSHTIKEQTVTRAVAERVEQLCRKQLSVGLLPIARRELAKALKAADSAESRRSLLEKIDSLSARLDRIYMDRLGGILEEDDFQRIYAGLKGERSALQEQLRKLSQPKVSLEEQADPAEGLAGRFLKTTSENRELLFSLIERVELTAERQIIIRFRFKQPQEEEGGP